MASAIITRLHCFRKFCLLLSKAIQLFHDILVELYNPAAYKRSSVAGCRLLTSSSKQPNLFLRVAQFSTPSFCAYSSSP